MAPDFKIRPARRGDRAALADLLRDYGYPNAADTNTMLWVFKHPEIDLFVAADALDRPVGYVSLSLRPQLRLSGRIATIDEFVVHTEWLSRGVSEALLQAALDRSQSMGAKRVELSTREKSPLGAEFWSGHGFDKIDNAVMRLASLEKR